jgi:hypothetical protein
MGVSAGAVQLGQVGWSDEGCVPPNLFETLGLVPFIVGAHGEREDWAELKEVVRTAGRGRVGLGIAAGGGAIYHSDNSLEPIRQPLHEFELIGTELRQRLLLPSSVGDIQAATEIC